MKLYLTPSFIPVKFRDIDVMSASTTVFGDDNFMNDTLTPDDMGVGL